MIVVSDTSPICYLILVGQIDLFPRLYGQVVISQVVQDELAHARSPDQVQQWIAQPPEWLGIQPVSIQPDTALAALDLGEQSAMLLVEQLGADLLVIDEMVKRRTARPRGFTGDRNVRNFGGSKQVGLDQFACRIGAITTNHISRI